MERISETRGQRCERIHAGIASDGASCCVEKLPKIVDAVAMIGVVMRPDHRIGRRDIGGEQLFPHVGRRIDQNARRGALDDD